MKQHSDICRVTVKFSEIDSMCRVWQGSYVTYFAAGRESFGRHYPGIGYADMQREGIYAPIYDMHAHYLAPLEINDVAEIHTRYVHHLGARLDYEFEVYRERDHTLCCTGRTTQLFITPDGQLMLDKPDYFVRWQQQWLEPEEGEQF
jgi:acyl-CoA thioester hydrolase